MIRQVHDGSATSLRSSAAQLTANSFELDIGSPLDYSSIMARGAPVAVVETPEFLAASHKLMDEAERSSLVLYLAHNPEAGDLVPGTGGVRKLRWALEGRGKRGGARVIYFYHNERLPLFVFSIYAKSTQSDLSDAAKNELKKVTKSIAEGYGRK